MQIHAEEMRDVNEYSFMVKKLACSHNSDDIWFPCSPSIIITVTGALRWKQESMHPTCMYGLQICVHTTKNIVMFDQIISSLLENPKLSVTLQIRLKVLLFPSGIVNW